MKDIALQYQEQLRKISFWVGAVCIMAGCAVSLSLLIPFSLQSVANVDTALTTSLPPTTLGITAAPGSCDSGKIVLSWTSQSAAVGYRLYRDNVLMYDGGNTTFTDSQLLPNSIHTYTLVTFSSTSSLGTATAIGTAPNTCATAVSPTINTSSTPPPPTGLKLVPGACGVASLTLTWQAVGGADAYRVMRNGTLLSDSPNIQYIDQALSLSTSYSYIVYAYNAYGVSVGTSIDGTTAPSCTIADTASTTTAATTATSTTPLAPTGLKAQVGSCGDPAVKLSWQGLSTVYGYKVFRNSILLTTTTGNSNTDLLTTPSTSYTYSVAAVNIQGTSPAALVQVTTPPHCVADASSTVSVNTSGPEPTTAPQPVVIPTTDATPAPPPLKTQPEIPPAAPLATTPAMATAFSSGMENVGATIQNFKKAGDETRTQLSFLIQKSADNIITERKLKGLSVDTAKVYAVRDELLQKVVARLAGVTITSAEDITALTEEVKTGIAAMRRIAGETELAATAQDDSRAITDAVSTLTDTLKKPAVIQAARDVALLYKDSNKDGISDYDSVHVYNLNPNVPSPVSLYDGKKITAADKILLGFNPTKKELVPIKAEEPASSTAPILSTYKVDHVDVSNTKISLTGRALPNTFVTLYIYSTPIIVTVKANAEGEWQYTLDKELESGNHTIYTATINNTGKILAKSPGFLFTKTAEAAPRIVATTTTPVIETTTQKPGLLAGSVPLGAGIIAIIIVGCMLIFAGRKREENTPEDQVTVA